MIKFVISLLKKRSILFSLLLFITGIPLYMVSGEAMQSNIYKITSDSINVGGQSSSSSVYFMGDSLGELGTGDSNSTNYFMHAGFWQMQESYIAISNPSDLALTSMGGLNGATSEGTLSWQVTTDNAAGYSMNIKTTTTPALRSSNDSFADYTPSGANPDYTYSIDQSTSAFGFSPEGGDVDARFKDNGSTCNTDTNETNSKCWDGLSTSSKVIFQRTTSNHQTGSTDVVRFRAESGTNHIQTSGSYSAPIIVTAITL